MFINEQILIVENTGHLTLREGSARDVEQNASNTEHLVLYGTSVNPKYASSHVCRQIAQADSMGEIVTRRDLFKMAANLHITPYPYSDTA